MKRIVGDLACGHWKAEFGGRSGTRHDSERSTKPRSGMIAGSDVVAACVVRGIRIFLPVIGSQC